MVGVAVGVVESVVEGVSVRGNVGVLEGVVVIVGVADGVYVFVGV